MVKDVKIAIVGPDGSKWTKGQEEKAKFWIKEFLSGMQLDDTHTFPLDLVIVSGHCPVGDEGWYCIDCNEWSNISCRRIGHRQLKIHKDGGVDIWAEIIATELGIKKEIYPAFCILNETRGHSIESCRDFYRTYPDYKYHSKHFWLYHFKPRNIKVATVSDVLYDIEPKGSCRHCKGIGFIGRLIPKFLREPIKKCKYCKGTGVYSGGTWTLRYAEKLGKEVHQIVIS